MRLRVLGCSGTEVPGHNLSAFLIDETLLLDAGTIGSVLSIEEQLRVNDILITHPHLDHIRAIPTLADNLVAKQCSKGVNVVGTSDVIGAIRGHLMNGVIWPDFSRIPSPDAPVVSYTEIAPEKIFYCGGFAVTAYEVNHTVPAVGYHVAKGGRSLAYTGDTGPTDRFWEADRDLSALIVEVSFPSEMEHLALLTRHLTPRLLQTELSKLEKLPPRILISHLKAAYRETIEAELDALAIPGLEVLIEGSYYDL